MTWGGAAPLRGAARTAVELFGWWRTELRDLTQWLLRQLPSRKTPEVLLRVADERLSLERREGSAWIPVLTLDPAQPLPDLPEPLRNARAAIALPASELFFDELQLPVAAERHLVSVLRLQLERRLPLPLPELLHDHELLPTDRKLGVLKVRVAVAHRERVEKLRELAVSLGLSPVSAGPLDPTGGMALNLLRRRRDPVRWNVSPLDLKLAKIAGAAAAALVAVVAAQWTYERAQVRSQVDELHAQAQKLRATRQALAAQAAPLVSLKAVGTLPAAPQLLATLSNSVPAPAWFSHVVLHTPAEGVATLELTGEVPSQQQVVEALRAVPGIRNLKTTSAFSGEILGSERVELTAEYVPVATSVATSGAAP
jgi:hypothetical protein